MNKYKYYVHRIPNIGDSSIYRLLSVFKDEKSIYEAALREDPDLLHILNSDTRYRRRGQEAVEYTKAVDLDRDYTRMLEQDIRFITHDHPEYPRRLRILNPMPYAIYVKGQLPEDDIPAVAIIGARQCSEYGTFTANAFGEALASHGINIISGMARGIDGISQRGALKSHGRTFGVLGSGVDVCYPLCNIKLYNEIQENGGILSIFPPGSAPRKQQFPERNKIVAALSDIVLVVEARLKSGTSITIDLSMSLGKEVYAVPGRLTDRLSDGCNLLLREGAGVALSPEDILRELTVLWNREFPQDESMSQNSIKNVSHFRTPKDIGVLKYLDTQPLSLDEIHAKRAKKERGCDITSTMAELISLCIEGRVIQIGTNYFQKSLPSMASESTAN